ncbi:MAG: hydrolase family protein [Paucimonas sp.]|nr:hydrolase family protein [Paucimonas sp.]
MAVSAGTVAGNDGTTTTGTTSNGTTTAGTTTDGTTTAQPQPATPVAQTGSAGVAFDPNAAATTTPTASAPVVIDYYGDSTIWGLRSVSGGQVGVTAPAAFAAALPASGKYVVRNEGVSGSTSCALLEGSDGKHPAWATQMANSNANVVIMNFAINDEWKMDLNRYRSCMTALASQARAAGKKVVFETPNPTRDSYPASLDAWAQAMRDLARSLQIPVIDQYQFLKNYLGGRSVTEICPDGLHPTDAVYVMKGKYAAQVFPSLQF